MTCQQKGFSERTASNSSRGWKRQHAKRSVRHRTPTKPRIASPLSRRVGSSHWLRAQTGAVTRADGVGSAPSKAWRWAATVYRCRKNAVGEGKADDGSEPATTMRRRSCRAQERRRISSRFSRMPLQQTPPGSTKAETRAVGSASRRKHQRAACRATPSPAAPGWYAWGPGGHGAAAWRGYQLFLGGQNGDRRLSSRLSASSGLPLRPPRTGREWSAIAFTLDEPLRKLLSEVWQYKSDQLPQDRWLLHSGRIRTQGRRNRSSLADRTSAASVICDGRGRRWA